MSLDPINRPVEDAVYADAGPVRSGEERKAAHTKAYDFQKETERNDLLTVLQSEQGIAVIMRILAHCAPYQPVPMGEHGQAGVMEGRRRVGLWLISQIQSVDPELYPRLLLSHLKRQRDSHSLEAAIVTAKPPPSL